MGRVGHSNGQAPCHMKTQEEKAAPARRRVCQYYNYNQNNKTSMNKREQEHGKKTNGYPG